MILKKLSIENSFGVGRLTVPRRSPRSTVPARSPRVTWKRAGRASRLTTTSSLRDRLGAVSISIRQPRVPAGGAADRKPLYRSRTIPATSGSCVKIPVWRPAISRLSSSMQGGSRAAPDVDGERKEQRQATREGSDCAIAPARDAGIEPPEAAVPLDRDHLAEKLRRIDDVDARESVAFGQEPISRAVDHAVHEEPSRRRLVADHVADTNLRLGSRHDERHVTVPQERQHASASGLDAEGVTAAQHLDGKLVRATHPGGDDRTRGGRRKGDTGVPRLSDQRLMRKGAVVAGVGALSRYTLTPHVPSSVCSVIQVPATGRTVSTSAPPRRPLRPRDESSMTAANCW